MTATIAATIILAATKATAVATAATRFGGDGEPLDGIRVKSVAPTAPNPDDDVRIADDTCLFVLDEAGVVFSGGRGELHAFNTAATYVWCAIEEGLTRSAIAVGYAQTFSEPPEQARFYVDALLKDWEVAGFLVPATYTTERRAPAASLSTTRRYSLLTTKFSLHFAAPEHEAWIHPVLSHLEIDETVEVDVSFEIVKDAGRHLLLEDSVCVEECDQLESLVPLLKDRIRRRVINRHPYFMQLHAGGVSDGKSCILLPGAPGSGKTTLTAGLVEAGFEYLSDEVVLLDEDSLEVRAVPLSLTVKPGAIPVLTPLFPELATLPTHQREDGQVVRYVNPPKGSLPADATRSYPVRALVFPRFCPDEPTTLCRIPRVDALKRLLTECLSMPRALDHGKARELVQWIRQVDCFELSSRSLDEAVEHVQKIAL